MNRAAARICNLAAAALGTAGEMAIAASFRLMQQADRFAHAHRLARRGQQR